MSQVLGIGEGKFLTFDRSWRDNGGDATYALIGGNKVLIQGASRAKPEIFQRAAGFYYKDGSPVTVVEDVSYLPKKYRDMAEKFINENADEAKPLKAAATREEAVAQAVKRGRGRPSTKPTATKSPIEVKDQSTFEAVIGSESA